MTRSFSLVRYPASHYSQISSYWLNLIILIVLASWLSQKYKSICPFLFSLLLFTVKEDRNIKNKKNFLLKGSAIFKTWCDWHSLPHPRVQIVRGIGGRSQITLFIFHCFLTTHPPMVIFFAMILLDVYLLEFAMVIFCWPPTHLNGIT